MWKSAKVASGVKAPIRMLTPSARQRLADPRRLQLEALELRPVLRRDDDPQPREQRHHVDREGDEERIAPAPLEEVRLGEAV